MKLYDALFGPNPFAVRLFIAERGHLTLDLIKVDLVNLENRGLAFRKINPLGTVPALMLEDGTVLSDIVAVCELLDEVATGGDSLIGTNATERAVTRMWTRRVDLGIAQRFNSWWRGGEDALDLYHGHRVSEAGGRAENRQIAERNLIVLDERLQSTGAAFIGGSRPMMPDILLFAFMYALKGAVPWLLPAARPEVAAWYERMSQRPSIAQASEQSSRISG